MTLTSDQCSVIALTIPVLLLALIVESRHVGVSRIAFFNALLIASNTGTFFVAVVGMNFELSTIPAVIMLLNVALTFITLAMLVYYGDRGVRPN